MTNPKLRDLIESVRPALQAVATTEAERAEFLYDLGLCCKDWRQSEVGCRQSLQQSLQICGLPLEGVGPELGILGRQGATAASTTVSTPPSPPTDTDSSPEADPDHTNGG